MGKLKEVSNRHNFVQREQELLDWWKEKEVVKKYLEKNKGSEKKFSFTDGPITANNQMGLHHAWGRAYKDFMARYKTMKGYEQRYQMGFDCQGLWVEVEVEKALGFNSKKDIDDYGLGNFTNACKDRVSTYSKVQTDQSVRLGMFMDWENSYYTMSETNNLYIWHFLKKAHEKGLLYKSFSSTTWCPRCSTGLSEHEKADGYKEVEDTSVYVLFKLVGRDNEYVLAWTTTPWTLSANVALAINKNFVYVKAKYEDKVVYLAQERAKKLGLEVLEEVDVNTLLGLEYESLYDIPVQEGVKHEVVEWELVSETDGTGVVHIAPGCGEEDFDLGKELGLPINISPLDEAGMYMEGYGDLTGKYAHDVKDEVFEYLKSKELLFKTENYTHTYPHCWRCKTKCLFRLENNWFIDIDKVRDQLKEKALTVNWIPDFAGKRMQDWLKNMGDWMISRKRFYGLSLPFYECSCGELTVIGSKEELRERAVDPTLVDKMDSMHRPWIDEVKIKCPKCGNHVTRITDVGDCWLDAGALPFSTLKYLEDKEYWKKWFKADWISESIEQVRLWFYSMLVFGVVLENEVPYVDVLTYGEMRDEKNDKMSKTKKNFIPFNEAADKVGSDLIRWTFMPVQFGRNLRFGWTPMEETRRRFVLPFWNSYTYFVMYANMHNWQYDKSFDIHNVDDLLDKWIIGYLNKVVEESNNDLDQYKFANFAERIEKFVMDLSTWYIRRSRDRFKNGNVSALNTIHYVLIQLSKLTAPFMPFMTEEMYQNLVVNVGVVGSKESVHLDSYPEVEVGLYSDVLEQMQQVRDLASLGQNIRVSSSIKLRQRLEKVSVKGTKLSVELQNVLKEELNVKEYVEDAQGEGWKSMQLGLMTLSLYTTISEELKKEGMCRELARQVQSERKNAGFVVGQKVKLYIYSDSSDLLTWLQTTVDQLKNDTSADSVTFEKKEGAVEFVIDDTKVYLYLEK